jgi:hypothetical protein
LAKLPPEEPDALVAHVRVCEGPGPEGPGLLGKINYCSRKIQALVVVGFLTATGLYAQEPNPQPTAPAGNNASQIEIRVNLEKVVHTMAGGIGASWHAMGPDVIHYPDLIGRDNRACKGSAYGGNPPVIPAFDKAWGDVYRHARWLGLDFIRAEIAMDMYNPRRGEFVWDNDEMKTLYRILEHCSKNKVDVYMTMQWQGVAWNAHPGINRLQSSPKSVEDFAVSYATLLEHLVKTKGYDCIRWITVNNEPGMGSGWWQGSDRKPDSIMPAMRATRAELNKRGLQTIVLCGPDGHEVNSGNFDSKDPAVGAMALHCYSGKFRTKFAEGLKLANERKLPFFLAEFGTFFMAKFEGDNMALGGPRSEAPKSYDHQMTNAEKILVGLNMGIDGFNRWSFLNRGDLDGQWQLVRTWNPNLWDFKQSVEPEPVPYYSFGIITRFTAKHSSVLETLGGSENLIATALRSPKGQLTLFLLNLSNNKMAVNIGFSAPPQALLLKGYQVTSAAVSTSGFKLEPINTVTIEKDKPALKVSIPARSITAYTTYDLDPSADGIMSE